MVFFKNAEAQTYCTASPTSLAGEYISSVSIDNQFTNNSGASSYTDYTTQASLTATLKAGSTYSFKVSVQTDSWDHHVWLYFDWDDNGSFETTQDMGTLNGAPATKTINYKIPASTANGNYRMRVYTRYNGDPPANGCAGTGNGEVEDYAIIICDGVNMSFNDVNTVTQTNVSPASRGTNNVQILDFNVKVSGCANKKTIQTATFGKADSDNITADAINAKLYYTGSSSAFSTATLVAGGVSPGNTFTFSSINLAGLSDGDNWFWLTYDIPAGATLDNYLDAELISIKYDNSTKTPTNGDPAGKRLIVNSYCNPTPANQAGAHITKVEIGSLSSSNSGNSLYGNFVSSVAAFDLCAGTENKLDVSFLSDVGYIDGAVPLFVHAYFDWNRDGDFTGEGEHHFVGHALSGTFSPITVNGQPIGGGPSSGTMSINVTAPKHAIEGPSVMRVVISREATATPCLGTADGETEDYGYVLSKAGSLTVSGDNVLCEKKAITLNASQTMASFDYQSSNDGVTWTTIAGTNSQSSYTTGTLDQTTYYRLMGTSSKCPNNEVYSDLIDVPFVGVTDLTSSKNQLCTNDTADLSASFEYPKQAFSATFGDIVPGATVTEFPIDVSGLPSNRINDAVLESVCLEIGTSAGADATMILLVGPGAAAEHPVLLSYGNGAESTPLSSESFCFSSDAETSITDETGLPSGSYTPEESFDRLKGIDPNGTWKLIVYNDYVDGVVQVDGLTLNFGVNDAITWSPAATLTTASGSNTRAFPSNTTQYKASLTNRFCTAEDSITLAVLSGSPINVTIDNVTPTGTVCEGNALTYTASLSQPIANPPLQWFVNNTAVPGETGLTFTSSTLQNGDDVKVEFNLVTPCGTFNSSDNRTSTIAPVVTPTLALAANATFPVCEGSPVVFTASANNFGPSPSYEWFVNSNPITNSGATYSTSSLNNGDVVEVTVSTTYECATVSTLTESITYSSTTELDPAITLVSDANTDLSCLGNLITFTADTAINNSGGSGVVKWFVDGKPISVPTMTTSSDTFSTGTHFVRVEYQVTSGCTKASFVAAQVQFEVGEDVIPGVSFTADNSIVCKGDSIEFTVTDIVNGGSSPQLQWFKNSQPVTGETGTTYKTNNFINQDEITVRLISSIECVSFEQAFAPSFVVKVAQRTPTEINIASDFAADPFCKGTRVLVEVNYSLGGGVKPDFEWFLNGVKVQKNSLLKYSVDTLKSGDQVYARMIPNSVCPTPTIPVSDTLTFTVNDLPFVDYQATQVGNDIQFIPNSVDFASYKWEFGTGETSGQISPSYQYNGQGSYPTCLTVVDNNGCTNKKCKQVQYTPVTSINNYDNEESISLYPNPSTGVVYLTKVSSKAQLVLSSLDGKVLSLNPDMISRDGDVLQLDLRDVSKGIYHLTVIENSKSTSFKLSIF